MNAPAHRLARVSAAVIFAASLAVASVAIAPAAFAASTCPGVIPASITTEADLAAAVAAAESPSCPGADTIDLAGATIPVTTATGTAFFTTTTVIEVTNGRIVTDGSVSAHFFTVEAGILSLNRITLEGASYGFAGGAVFVASGAALNVADSVLAGNTAAGGGGGIFSLGSTTIVRSSISGNTANNAGGGIHAVGSLVVFDSTFSGNSSPTGGSGISFAGTTAAITNATIANNSGSAGFEALTGSVQFANSILAGTIGAPDCTHLNTFSTIGFSGGLTNLIQDDADCGVAASDYLAADPLLIEVSEAPAHFLLGPGSPATDAGSSALVGGTTDQLGNPRVQSGSVDLGSIEKGSQVGVVQFAAATTGALEGALGGPSFLVSTDDGAPTASSIQFSFASDGGTAQAADYVISGSGIVTVPAGTPDGAVLPLTPLTIVNDAVAEPDESIELVITGGSGGSIGAQAGTAHTILDDDAPKLAATGSQPLPLLAGAAGLLMLGMSLLGIVLLGRRRTA